MNFYRCQICGEVYFGMGAPSHCPFCGVLGKYLVPADNYVDENLSLGKLSRVSNENLLKALQLEVNNSLFYCDAKTKTKNIEIEGTFKYLQKVEDQHAWVIRNILNVEFPQPEPGKEVATNSDRENILASHSREVSASNFYGHAAADAIEPRVKKVFVALSEVEKDHHELDEDLLKRV